MGERLDHCAVRIPLPGGRARPARHRAAEADAEGIEEVHLRPDRSAYWPARRTLLVADLHLGKAETFQAFGIGIPGAVTDETLARLADAIERTGARRVLILGDLVHARPGLTERLEARVAAWRAGLVAVELGLVSGNHDRALGDAAERWRLEPLGDVHRDGPFAFTHEPAAHAGAYTWAGHVHPVVRLRSSVETLRLPAFHIGRRVGVLPAFGLFSAGGTVPRRAGGRVYAVTPGGVVEMS